MDHERGPEQSDGPPPAGEEPQLLPALRLLARAFLAQMRRLWRRLLAAGPPLSDGARRAGGVLRQGAAQGGALLAQWRAAAAPLRDPQKRPPVRPAPAPPPRRRRGVFFTALLAGTAVLLAGAGFLGYCAFTIPLSGGLAGRPEPAALVLETSAGKPFATRGIYRGEPVTAKSLPATVSKAVVAIEDRRFFENPGIDLWGILRAAIHDFATGSEKQGASTITQQLVRLTYLSPERTIRRKVQEAMLALWLEARLDKKEILARYLNAAYFGNGAYGIDAAARRYFNKKAADLDLAQSAMLAGLIQAPTALAPTTNLAAAQQRAGVVLQAMVRARDITPAEAAAASAHPAVPIVLPQTQPGENYFADTAAVEVQHLFGKPPTDLVVRTTLDPSLQHAAEQVVRRWLGREGKRRHVGEAALVALSPDGAVRALVGGTDYGKSQFNRVTEARRQPGSLFKIFVYLTAFNAGFTPDSVLVDKPVQIGNWEPRNYGHIYRGAVSLRTAFAQSINSVSAQLGQQVGIPRIVAMAKSLGVKSPLQPVPSLALGSEGVTLFEMTQAMAEIAEGTQRLAPYTVSAVFGHNAAPLYKRVPGDRKAADWRREPMLDLLRAVVTEGTGKAAALDRPVYGKTGTTNEYRDAWFVGFTDDWIVGVWVGNDDNSPTKGVVGGDLPAKIWHDFVAEAERLQPAGGAAAAAGVNASGEGAAGEQRPPEDAATAITGVPRVVDTATLNFDGRVVHLQGVEGEGGQSARDMARYIAGREVTCEPAEGTTPEYSCRVGGYDLGEAVIYNGGGRAAADAPSAFRSAEEEARLYGRGLWQQR